MKLTYETDDMGLEDLLYTAQQMVESWLEKNTALVSADQVGLDPRCGLVWVTKDIDDEPVIVSRSKRSIDYYGGFEYIDSEFVSAIADYTFYRTDGERDSRVQACFDCYHKVERDEDEDE